MAYSSEAATGTFLVENKHILSYDMIPAGVVV